MKVENSNKAVALERFNAKRFYVSFVTEQDEAGDACQERKKTVASNVMKNAYETCI